MDLPERRPAAEEQVVHVCHPHWRRLVLPVAALVGVVLAAGVGMYAVPGDYRYAGIARLTIAVVALVAVVLWSLVPYLRWRSTVYTLTTQRFRVGTGILHRAQDDVPLAQVVGIGSAQNLLERLLGCGTLIVESAGERGELRLRDVPRLHQVRAELFRLVGEAADDRHDDG